MYVQSKILFKEDLYPRYRVMMELKDTFYDVCDDTRVKICVLYWQAG